MAPIAAYLMQQGAAIPIKQIVTFAAPSRGTRDFKPGINRSSRTMFATRITATWCRCYPQRMNSLVC